MSDEAYKEIYRYLRIFVEEKYSKKLLLMLDKYNYLFRITMGSSHNHQAWEGGYLDHVSETMKIAFNLYNIGHAGSTNAYLDRSFEFSISDALVVLFLHDIEKPWKPFPSKLDRQIFKENLFKEWELELSPQILNGIKYIEGEGDKYSNKQRTMGSLAAFCHCCDVISARIWFDYPRIEEDWLWKK